MSNMFDDARNRLIEKNKYSSSAEDIFDAARKRLAEKTASRTDALQNTAASSDVSTLLPVPDRVQGETDRRSYAAQMQQKAPAGLTEGEFNRSSAMQEKYGSYQNYLVRSALENLKKSSYGESNTPRIDTSNVTHSSGNFVNVEDMKPLQRVWNSVKRTLTGGLKGSLGSNVNTQGVAYQGGQNIRNEYYNDQMAQYQKELDAAIQRQNYMKQHISDGQFTQEDVDAEQNYIDYYNMMLGAYGTGLAAQQGATKETYKLADKITENAEKDIQSAKDTSYGGKFGEMLVDAGASTVQSSADALASMLLTGQNPIKGVFSGAPIAETLRTNAANATHTMAPFVIRAFGSGAQKARQEMEAKGTANDENAFAKQVAYGVADAAKEWITEKLGGIGAGGVYADADGFLDEFWGLVGDGFAEMLTKSAAGRRVISSITSAFIGEGAEEAIGDYLEYIFSLSDIYGGADESIIKDWKAGNGLGEKAKNVAKGLVNKLYDATEDFVVGGLSGVMGGAVQAANEIAGTAAVGRDFRNMGVQNAQDFIDTGLESLPGTESRQLAQLLQQKQDAGKNISNYELGRLYNANVEAVNEEEKARQALIAEDAERYADANDAAQQNGNITLPTAAQNGVLPTDIANQQNRGILNTTENKEEMFNGGREQAESAGDYGFGEGRMGIQSQRSSVEVGRVDEGAAATGAGNSVVGETQRAGGNRPQVRTDARDREVSTKVKLDGVADASYFGIERGDSTQKVRLVESGSTKSMQTAEKITSKSGYKLTPYVGGYLGVGDNHFIQAASMPNGDIVASADDPEFTIDRLAGHEVCEGEIRKGNVSVNDAIRAAREQIGDEKVDSVLKTYKSLKYDSKELVCDAAGNMNRLAAYSEGNDYLTGLKNDLDDVIRVLHDYVNSDGAFDDVPALEADEEKTEFSRKSDVSELEERNERKENENIGRLSQNNQAPVQRRNDRGRNDEESGRNASIRPYRTFSRRGQGEIRREILNALSKNDYAAYNYFHSFGTDKFIEKAFDFISNGNDYTALENEFPGLHDAVVSGTLKAMGLTEDDGNARWTPERINSLYQEYSAKTSGSDDYAKAYAVILSPSEFHSLTATAEDRTVIDLDTATKSRYNYGNLDQSILKKVDAPRLYVDMRTGEVVNHEGRHRMSLLANAGIDSVSVVIVPHNQSEYEKYHTEKIDRMTLKGQSWSYGQAPGNVTVTDVTPFSNRYRDEIEKRYGGEAQVQFSMAAPVEEINKMIAWHNISSSAIDSAIELGGLAMPSWAVKRADSVHGDYGDISVIAHKDSIDPKRSKTQMIFSGDAWTPVFPSVDYKINDTAASAAYDKINGLLKQADTSISDFRIALDPDNVAETLARHGGSFVESYKDNDGMKLAFLKDTGRKIVVPMREKAYSRYADIAALKEVIKQFPDFESFGSSAEMEAEPKLRSIVHAKAVRKYGQEIADKLWPEDKELTFNQVDDIFYAARRFSRDGAAKTADTQKLSERIDALMGSKKINAEYEAWLENVSKDIVAKKGIRNNADLYTPSGNRRSFDALHYDYNLANIVRAMQGQPKQGRTQFLSGSGSVKGAALKSFGSIEEVRAELGRLVSEESEESKEAYDKFSNDTLKMANKISDDPFTGSDMLSDILSNAKTAPAIERYLNREYKFLETQDHMNLHTLAQQIYELGQEANTLPMEYFEAKTYRAFPFSEAAAVVVPNTMPKETRQKLVDLGANVLTYKAGDNADRLKKVNSVQGAQFSSAAGTEDLKALQAENKRLQKKLEEAKRQTTLTTTPTFTDRTIARAANNLIRMVGSDTKADEIKPRLKEFFDYMANDPTSEGMQERAYDIGSDLVDNAKEMVGDDVDFYKRMAGYLRDNKLFLSKDYRSDVNYSEFVKNNPKIKMSSKGIPVDVAYAELQEIFGDGLFPQDVTHPADQLEQIADALNSMEPFYRNPYSLEMAKAYNWAANAVIDEYFDAKEAPATFADKAAKKLESQANKYEKKLITQQANYEDELTKQKADYEAEIERRRQNAAFMVKSAVAKEKRLRDEKIAALKEHYQSVNERKRELKQERNDREKLRKIVKRLQSNKIDPVTKSMLPAIVRELDATAVNLTDKSVEKLSELRQWYDDKTTEGSDIFDPNFIPDKATIAKLKRLEKAMNGKTIGQMTILEVRELTEVLQNIEYQMHEGRKYQQSKLKIDNHEAGLRTIQDINNARPGKINRELSPQRAARRIAGYNDGAIEGTEASPLITLMDETVEGERKADLYQRTALHRLSRWTEDKEFMRKLYGRRAEQIMITGIDVKTGEARNVAITPAMRISLYLHSKNDDNMRHIQEGGVVVPAMNLYRSGNISEAYAADIRIKLTKANVNRISSGMSSKERAFADAIWRYFNEYAPQRLNEASVLIDGYEKFIVENYFPIDVDKNFLSQDYESVIMDQDGSLTHPGFGEERIQSAKPIYLRDVNDVFMNAVRTNSMYACQAVPLMNLSKLINVQQVGATDSVAAALNRKFTSSKMDPVSTSASDYLAKYMRDYAGNKGGKKSGTDRLLAKIRSNYSGGVLTLAAGTAIKQAASYPTAAAVTSTRSLIQALNPSRTVNTAFIDERTAAFTKRTEGLSTVELAEMTQEGKHIPRPLNWIQFVDVATTKALKRAAAIEIQRTTNLQLGTEEYEKAVTDLYIKIIEETQPNYSIALRPDILRSDSALERALVMFATQPMQNFGILYDALGDYRAKSQAYSANKSKATESAKKAAGKKLGKAIGSQLASSIVFALMQYLYDAFRKKDDKYKDDGKTTFLSFFKGIGINMLSNGAGMFIAGKVALEFGETVTDKIVKAFGGDAVFNTSIYGFEVAELSAITDAATSAINAAGAITTELYKAIDGKDETTVNVEKLARKTWTAAEDVLILLGIPLQNATTMLTSAAKQICTKVMGKYVGGYYALRISTDPDDSKKPFYDLVWESIQNGTKSDEKELMDTMLEDGFDRKKIQDDINGRYYDKIWENINNYNEMMRWYREAISHGVEEGNIRSSMESRMKEKEGVDSVKDLKRRWDDIIG